MGLPRGHAGAGTDCLWFAKDPTQALVIGQVVLSIGIPFAVIPLMRYTHDKELMGKWADGTVKHVIFMIVVALIVALNVLLIVLTLMGRAYRLQLKSCDSTT